MTEPSDLQFEHATYAQAPTGVTCGMCGKPVGGEFWQWMGRVACASCRDQVYALEAKANAPATFAKAALLGTGAALGCGVAYAVFVSFTHSRWALITIGIAYVIASVIRKATNNVSGRRYQVLAVFLTYIASAMGYLGSLGVNAEVIRDAPLAVLTAVLIGPVGIAFEQAAHGEIAALLGPLIIGIGLWEAWRRARGLPMVVTGPFRVAPQGQVPAP